MAGLPQFFKFDEPTAGEIRRAKVLAVGGQRPRCKKGKACSAACIDPGESCLVEFPDPASVGLGKLSNKIEQLSLFDTNKYYSKEYISEVKAKREQVWKGVSDGIKGSLSSNPDYSVKESYNLWRQTAKDFNKELVEKGISDKVKPLKVPVKWEVYKAISERYDKVERGITVKLMKANVSRNKAEYDRQEQRLINLYEKLGKKVGKTPPLKEFLWTPDPEKAPPLKPLNTTKQFEDRDKKTDGLSKKLEQLSMEVAKLLGTTNRAYVGFEDLYRSDREKEDYINQRIKFLKGKQTLTFSDAVVALEEYTLSSKTAREIRSAQRSDYTGPRKYERMASDIEALLRWDQIPKPPVEKYRGFRAEPERLNEMIESARLKEKFKHDTMYSWTSSLGQGSGFADARLNDLPERTERVIFRAINKRGVPIEYVSENSGEYEMLTHGKVNYQYLGYRPIDMGNTTYHVFDVKEF